MEERIVKYIKNNVEDGNLTAFNILVNIALEMILQDKSEEQIISRINILLLEPSIRNQDQPL